MIEVPPFREHPAKFSKSVLNEIAKICLREHERLGRKICVLDPMAGVGRIHRIAVAGAIETHGVEIEPEWADQHPMTNVGNATSLQYPAGTFDVVATSPPYGNRMADTFISKDGTRRITYYHMLGRALHDDNAGSLHFGPEYQAMMQKIYCQIKRVLTRRGLFVLNVSNFIRDHKELEAVEWHIDYLISLGFKVTYHEVIATPRMRMGANHRARVEGEHLIALRKNG